MSLPFEFTRFRALPLLFPFLKDLSILQVEPLHKRLLLLITEDIENKTNLLIVDLSKLLKTQVFTELDAWDCT